MTPWSKPVTRLTQVLIRDGGAAKQLVVTLEGSTLSMRLHGRRQVETISLEHAYFGAIKARAFNEKMVKAKARKEKADRAAASRAFNQMAQRAVRKAKKEQRT